MTPEHARANGEAESFMKLLNRSEQISQLQGKSTIQDMLIGYRSTPHPATNVTPYEVLMNRPVRTKLHVDYQTRNNSPTTKDAIINERDKQYNEKLKLNAENRNTKQHNFIVGDYVLLKQAKKNKWSTAYEPVFYIIYRIDNSSIAARRVTDGREVYRDASWFKLANAVVHNTDDTLLNQDSILQDPDDWRENLLLETTPDNQPEHNNLSSDNSTQQMQDTPLTSQKMPDHETYMYSRPKRNRQRPAYLKDYVE